MTIRYTSSFDQTLPFSDTCMQFNLTANNAQTTIIPGTSDQKFILTFGLSSNANIFIGYNVTATVPANNTNSNTHGLEFIIPGEQRYAIGGDVLSMKSPDTNAYLGVSIRSIPN